MRHLNCCHSYYYYYSDIAWVDKQEDVNVFSCVRLFPYLIFQFATLLLQYARRNILHVNEGRDTNDVTVTGWGSNADLSAARPERSKLSHDCRLVQRCVTYSGFLVSALGDISVIDGIMQGVKWRRL